MRNTGLVRSVLSATIMFAALFAGSLFQAKEASAQYTVSTTGLSGEMGNRHLVYTQELADYNAWYSEYQLQETLYGQDFLDALSYRDGKAMEWEMLYSTGLPTRLQYTVEEQRRIAHIHSLIDGGFAMASGQVLAEKQTYLSAKSAYQAQIDYCDTHTFGTPTARDTAQNNLDTAKYAYFDACSAFSSSIYFFEETVMYWPFGDTTNIVPAHPDWQFEVILDAITANVSEIGAEL